MSRRSLEQQLDFGQRTIHAPIRNVAYLLPDSEDAYGVQVKAARTEVLDAIIESVRDDMKPASKPKSSNGKTKTVEVEYNGVRALRNRDDGKTPKKHGISIADVLGNSQAATRIFADTLMPEGHTRLFRVPGAPVEGEAKTLWSARKEAEVEQWMLMGVQETERIAELAKIKVRTARQMMERVKARWALVGSAYDVKAARGRMLNYIQFFKGKVWERIQAKDSSSEHKGYCLALLSRMFGVEMILDGVNERTIQELSETADETGELATRVRKQKALGGIARQLVDVVRSIREEKARNARIQEHMPADVPRKKKKKKNKHRDR